MTSIHTAYGEGRIVAQENYGLGKKRYRVAGVGFDVWMDGAEISKTAGNPRDRAGDAWASGRDRGDKQHMEQDLDDRPDYHDMGHNDYAPKSTEPSYDSNGMADFGHDHYGAAAFDFEPSQHTWDNHTTLPYNWRPQFPVDMFRDEQTQSPDHEIDADERLHSSDSRSGERREEEHPYPGPAKHLFADFHADPAHPSYDVGSPALAHPPELEYDNPGDPNSVATLKRQEGTSYRPGQGRHRAAGRYLHDLADEQHDDWMNHAKIHGYNPADDAEKEAWLDRTDPYREARAAGHFDGPDDGPGPEHDPYYEQHSQDLAHEREQDFSHFDQHPPHTAGLDSRYADIMPIVAHNDPVWQFRNDPDGTINRHAAIDLSAGLDSEVGLDQDDHVRYASKQLKEAKWRDVAQKAYRLKREGAVHVHAMDPSAIYATVAGDHGDYEVMILRGSAYSGLSPTGMKKQAIANWKCSCDWGKWAFKRKLTFVGRLCSHGYAAYLTQQGEHMADQHRRRKTAADDDAKTTSLEDFKKWVKSDNDDHIDFDAADLYLQSRTEEPDRDDAQAIYDYVLKHHSEHEPRDYDVKGYHYDNDGVLQNKPGKLNPHSVEVPELSDEDHHYFTDLGDDRKTTGPDQIMAKMAHAWDVGRELIAKGEDKIKEHHPDFAWHNDSEDDFPEDGIVHFSSRVFTSDENQLQHLRDLSQEPPDLGNMAAHNEEVRNTVEDLRERGFDASPMVASLHRAALWKTADEPGQDPNDPNKQQQQPPGYVNPGLTPGLPPGSGPTPGTNGTVGPLPIPANGAAAVGPAPGSPGGPSSPPMTPPAASPTGGKPAFQGESVEMPKAPTGTPPAGPAPKQQSPAANAAPAAAAPAAPAAPKALPGASSPNDPNGVNSPGIGGGTSSTPSAYARGVPGQSDLKAPGSLSGADGGAGSTTGTGVGGPGAAPKAAPAAPAAKPAAPASGGQNTDFMHSLGELGHGLFAPGGTMGEVTQGGGNALKGLDNLVEGPGKGLSALPKGPNLDKGFNSLPALAPVNKAGAAQHFAMQYFADAEGESSNQDDSSDPNKKNQQPGQSSGGQAPGGLANPAADVPSNYKQVSQGNPLHPGRAEIGPGAGPTPNPSVTNPLASPTNSFGESLTQPSSVAPGGSTGNTNPGDPSTVTRGKSSGESPTGSSTSTSTPGGTSTTPGANPATGQGNGLPMGGMGMGGMGGMGMGLGGALGLAESAIGGLLGRGGGGGLLRGLGGGGLRGLGRGLHLRGANDAERYAAQYFEADNALRSPEGGDWMDYPFAGSGPLRQDFHTTSEQYVEQNERTNHHDNWATDDDGDIIHDWKPAQRPKQSSRRLADAGTGNAGYGNPGPATGGGGIVHAPGGGGGFEEAPEGLGATPSMGSLSGMSTASRQFWADVEMTAGPHANSPTGYFGHGLHGGPEYDKGDTGLGEEFDDKGDEEQQGHGGPHGSMDAFGGDAAEAEEGAGAAGEAAELAPLLLAARTDDGSDIVRQFQASGAGALGGGGGSFGDDAIAAQARKQARLLKTAGRHYSLAEQRELEDEGRPRAARNLGSLDLNGTHYVD